MCDKRCGYEKKIRRFVVINGVIPILLGVIIYYLIAPETFFSKTIDDFFNLNIHIGKEYVDGCIFRFIRFYGLDMIWGYSFTVFVGLTVKDLKITFIIAALFSVIIETLQLSVLPGVFDPLDIILQVVAVVFAIIMIRRQNNEGYEKKIVELVVIMSVFAMLAIGSGSNDSGTVSNEDSNTTTSDSSSDSSNDSSSEAEDDDSSKESSNEVVKVGGSFEKDGLKFTFKKADTNYKPSDDKYGLHKPSKGKKYVACTFKFENNGDSDEYVSIYDFNCYADNESCEQQYISTEDFKNGDFINENLSSGRNVTFTTFYEVPKKAKSIQLEYEPSFWSDEKVIIQVK